MTKTRVDSVDPQAWRLLVALQRDARAPLKALAAECGLSVAATAERLRRLQEAGLITRLTAEVDAALLGYGVKAIIGITVQQPGKAALLEKLRQSPEVLECHHVAGADSFLMTVVALNLADLERFIGTINGYGETRTSIVFSTPIERRELLPPDSGRRRPVGAAQAAASR